MYLKGHLLKANRRGKIRILCFAPEKKRGLKGVMTVKFDAAFRRWEKQKDIPHGNRNFNPTLFFFSTYFEDDWNND
jgi:hypothetical protein